MSEASIKFRNAQKKEWGNGKWWFVYYLPEENYCGISKVPSRRIDEHRANRQGCKNVDGWRILYATKELWDAKRVESEFHLMGMFGSGWTTWGG